MWSLWSSSECCLFVQAVNEATCTWSGQLPPRNYKNPVYSCKVFLGGVPWDITEGEQPTAMHAGLGFWNLVGSHPPWGAAASSPAAWG